jgi:hypothetical protein
VKVWTESKRSSRARWQDRMREEGEYMDVFNRRATQPAGRMGRFHDGRTLTTGY